MSAPHPALMALLTPRRRLALTALCLLAAEMRELRRWFAEAVRPIVEGAKSLLHDESPGRGGRGRTKK